MIFTTKCENTSFQSTLLDKPALWNAFYFFHRDVMRLKRIYDIGFLVLAHADDVVLIRESEKGKCLF